MLATKKVNSEIEFLSCVQYLSCGKPLVPAKSEVDGSF